TCTDAEDLPAICCIDVSASDVVVTRVCASDRDNRCRTNRHPVIKKLISIPYQEQVKKGNGCRPAKSPRRTTGSFGLRIDSLCTEWSRYAEATERVREVKHSQALMPPSIGVE